jgi:hyperosmotically inducible protein
MQTKISGNFLLALRNIVFVIMTGVLFCACSVFSGQETTGEYIDDTTITTSVKTAIAKEPTLSAFQIHVETMQNVVQLSGFVNTRAEIDTAGRVARSTKGVESVKNSLKIRKKH